MNADEPVAPIQLPAVVCTLIDFFRELHGAAQPHLVLAGDREATSLYPRSGELAIGNDYEVHTLATADQGAIQLLLRRGCAPAEQTEQLVDALGNAFNYEREARSSAQELSDRYEEINLLYSISEILGSVRSFEEGAVRILAEVMDVLSARRASLWVFRPENEMLDLVAAVGEDGLRGPIALADNSSATAWVFREKQPMNVERDPTAAPGPDRPRPRGGEAFLSVPINYTPPDSASRTVGVVTLVGRRTGVRFTTGDERLLSAIASQIGAAIEAHRLLEESVRQERLLRELELAHDLQLKLLPGIDAFAPPPEIAGRCVPAESVGGDFYQLYHLTGQRLGVLIGDVSSHGFSAALIMALTMSAIGIYVKEEEAPAEVLRRVHRALIKEFETTEMYLSLFYGVLNEAQDRLDYANAGHPQAYRIEPGGHVARLGATGPPLGVTSDEPFGERCVRWQGGDILLLFTDGLSDAFAERVGSPSGERRLLQFVADQRAEPLDATVQRIFAEAQRSTNSPVDDRTLLLVRR
jgi:sigma-B regulation protein RsbU (phosphoserine phosphatase)